MTKSVYVVLGITLDGKKDILGMWIGEHESSKIWLNVLNYLKAVVFWIFICSALAACVV